MRMWGRPRYRIVKVRDDYPWQIQKRVWSFFWRDTCLCFGRIRIAKKALEFLLSNQYQLLITLPKIARYRIIRIDNICPWQIQERAWLFFWRDKYLSFSSICTAEKELNSLIELNN